MPVKNTAQFLVECLESILHQTCTTWELIAVDDHSTDDSYAILTAFSAKDKRIRVLKNEGAGIICALRRAYADSSGRYITRMDSDDVMMPIKLELLKKQLIRAGRGSVAVGCVSYFSSATLGAGYKKYADWLNGLTCGHDNFSEIYKECVIPSPCWMIYRGDLDLCEAFQPDTYPEDYDLCFRFYQARYNIAGTSEILHRWRDHPGRTSRTHEHYADNRFLDLKFDYFIKLDYHSDYHLCLWGAGKKGKLIARKLIDRGIAFSWISNNEKKIGRDIYGVMIQSSTVINRDNKKQYIIAVANEKEQAEIVSEICRAHRAANCFYFC